MKQVSEKDFLEFYKHNIINKSNLFQFYTF